MTFEDKICVAIVLAVFAICATVVALQYSYTERVVKAMQLGYCESVAAGTQSLVWTQCPRVEED